MTGPKRNSEFCFTETLNIEGHCFCNCIFIHLNSKKETNEKNVRPFFFTFNNNY